MNYIYTRISTDQQNETSFEVQEEVVRRHLALVNSDPISVIKEVGSGKDTEGRPLFIEMISKLKQGDIVAVYDNSRFSRNIEVSLFLLKEITSKGAKLLCDGKFIDPDNPQDNMVFNIQSVFSTYQRQIQNKKSIEGLKKRYANGDAVFTGRMIGYNIVKKGRIVKAEIIEDEAKVIRYIYEQIADGNSINKVTKEAYKSVTERNIVFHKEIVRCILHRPIYMGYYLIDNGYNRKMLSYSEDFLRANLVKSNIYPPIVSEELWWACYKVWSVRGKAVPKNRFTIHELSGVYKCPICEKGIAFNRSSNYGYDKITELYELNKHTPTCTGSKLAYDRKWLERVTRLCFYITFLCGDEVGAFFKEKENKLYEGSKEITSAIESVNKSISELEKKKANVVKAIADGIIDINDAKSVMEGIKDELYKYTEKMNGLNEDLMLIKSDISDVIETSSAEVIDYFDTDRRSYYLKYVKTAYCYIDHLELEFFNGKKYWISRLKKYGDNYKDTTIKISYNGKEQMEVVYKYTENSVYINKENAYLPDTDEIVKEYLIGRLNDFESKLNSVLAEWKHY